MFCQASAPALLPGTIDERGVVNRRGVPTDMTDRKVVLKMVMSLDGFVTSPDGTHEWMFEWFGEDSGEWNRRAPTRPESTRWGAAATR
jgi:hypothetical protein